jgi:diguanylate cyclase (GGDEF)-like protein/PAS domain S-box-containing protein
MYERLHESLHSLFHFNPDPCYVLDAQGRFEAFNNATLTVTGYSREELLHQSFLPLIYPEHAERTQLIFQRVLSGGHEASFDVSIIRKDGELLELSVTAVPVWLDGKVSGVAGVAKDVTRRNQMERSLVKAQLDLKNIFDSIDVCLWSNDLVTGEIKLSAACDTIYGYSQEAFQRDRNLLRKVIYPPDAGKVEKRQRELLGGKKLKQEYRIVRSNGDIRWVHDNTIPVLDEHGAVYRLEGVITDITERKKSEERLQTLAFQDALTGLPNRRLIRDRLRMAIIRAERRTHKVVVMYLDLDGFKFINDSLGHGYGDRLLQIVSKRLKRCLRAGDTVARIGGDEFAVVLEEVNDVAVIEKIATKLLSVITEPIVIEQQELVVTTSLGICVYPDHGVDHETLFKRADQAMYAAKEKGKNNFQLYNEHISEKFNARLMLEQGLRKALDRKEFVLYYQPIVNAVSGRIVGVEALIRWQHATGMIPPSQFISLAEESGLIIPIGEWALREACTQCKHWQDMGYQSLSVSVNMCARQLEEPNVVEMVQLALDESGLDPSYLHIEITESSVMTNMNRAIDMLRAIGRLGVSISIDDFGTGYSSLSYLEKFPINAIKIDQSFIHQNQFAIIRAIIAIAASCELTVIAEGVEDREQLQTLQEMGCTKMQGYWFSPPISAYEFGLFLGRKAKRRPVRE